MKKRKKKFYIKGNVTDYMNLDVLPVCLKIAYNKNGHYRRNLYNSFNLYKIILKYSKPATRKMQYDFMVVRP